MSRKSPATNIMIRVFASLILSEIVVQRSNFFNLKKKKFNESYWLYSDQNFFFIQFLKISS